VPVFDDEWSRSDAEKQISAVWAATSSSDDAASLAMAATSSKSAISPVATFFSCIGNFPVGRPGVRDGKVDNKFALRTQFAEGFQRKLRSDGSHSSGVFLTKYGSLGSDTGKFSVL